MRYCALIPVLITLALPLVGDAQQPLLRVAERIAVEHAQSSVQPVHHVEELDSEVLIPPLPVAEPEQPLLSLIDLEQLALANHPALSVAAARIDAARGLMLQAGLYPNPIVGYHGTEIGTLDSSGAQGPLVRQRIITGGKRHLDQAVADAQVNEAHFRFTEQELRVLSDLRVRYYNALVAQRRLTLTAQLARIGDDLVQTSQQLHKARQISENDLLQAEVEAEQIHVLHANARNEQREQWRRLAAVIGIPTLREERLAGSLADGVPQLDWQTALADLLTSSPQLAAAHARVERARLATARAKREWVPNVDTFVSVRNQDLTRDNIVNVRVGLPIPLFDANQGNIATANAQWAAAQNDVRRIELDLQDRLAVAFRRYANARQEADRYRQRILPRAQRSLELVKDAYAKNQVDYLTLLTAQRTYYRVNLEYLDAVQELWEAVNLIEGRMLSGSLAEIR